LPSLFFSESSVVFYQFLERHRPVPTDHASAVISLIQGSHILIGSIPEGMDVSVDMIRPSDGVLPLCHRIMAEDDLLILQSYLLDLIDGFKVLMVIHIFQEGMVMVTDNQMEMPGKPREIVGSVMRLIVGDEISHNKDVILRLDCLLPVKNQGLIHILDILKRTVVDKEIMLISEMEITREKNHTQRLYHESRKNKGEMLVAQKG
jgi:hypothetical protein